MLSHAQRAAIWLIDGTSVLNGWRNNTKTVDLAQASPWSEVLNFSVLVLVRACPIFSIPQCQELRQHFPD